MFFAVCEKQQRGIASQCVNQLDLFRYNIYIYVRDCFTILQQEWFNLPFN